MKSFWIFADKSLFYKFFFPLGGSLQGPPYRAPSRDPVAAGAPAEPPHRADPVGLAGFGWLWLGFGSGWLGLACF